MVWMLCIISVPGTVDQSKVSALNTNLHLMHVAVREFYMTYGRYPTEAEGLRVLFYRPATWTETKAWQPVLEGMPRDHWNRQFVYLLHPDPNHRFGFYSFGADGVSTSRGNDRDDINSWNKQAPWRSYFEARGAPIRKPTRKRRRGWSWRWSPVRRASPRSSRCVPYASESGPAPRESRGTTAREPRNWLRLWDQ
jgi:type II secretion system protein G